MIYSLNYLGNRVEYVQKVVQNKAIEWRCTSAAAVQGPSLHSVGIMIEYFRCYAREKLSEGLPYLL